MHRFWRSRVTPRDETIKAVLPPATWAAANVPPAPGRLSTTTRWPSRGVMKSASTRATMSEAPPGGKVTTRRTGREGQARVEEEAARAGHADLRLYRDAALACLDGDYYDHGTEMLPCRFLRLRFLRMAETATACCAGDARLRAMLADDPLFREGYPLLKAGV